MKAKFSVIITVIALTAMTITGVSVTQQIGASGTEVKKSATKWVKVESGIDEDLNDVFFVDASVLVAIGRIDILYRCK